MQHLPYELLRQLGQLFLDAVDELLRVGFVRGGAALVVLVVAQRGLRVGAGAEQAVSLPLPAFLPTGGRNMPWTF